MNSCTSAKPEVEDHAPNHRLLLSMRECSRKKKHQMFIIGMSVSAIYI